MIDTKDVGPVPPEVESHIREADIMPIMVRQEIGPIEGQQLQSFDEHLIRGVDLYCAEQGLTLLARRAPDTWTDHSNPTFPRNWRFIAGWAVPLMVIK